MRALAPATAAQLENGDPFAAQEPGIAVKRFPVPHAYTTAYRPAEESYHRSERDGISEFLPAMIAERRPDIVFIGRESFAWHVPKIAEEHRLPCILRAAGATTAGIMEGTYPLPVAKRLIEQWCRTSLVITPSEYVATELRRMGVSQVRVILNAVDLRAFSPAPRDGRLMAELGIENTATVIAYIGNLNERKRPLDIVRSSVQVLARCPDVVYLIIGEGPLREEAMATSRALGVGAKFRFVDWQRYEHMPKYINLADLVVLPSFGEGLARVYLEAQACARVLIASDILPAREVVDHGETGLLFPVGDVDALAQRCIQAAVAPLLRARLGQAALERVQRHDIRAAVTRYLSAFETIVRSSAPSSRR